MSYLAGDYDVAIIGAGPSGITSAIILARKGFDVYLYEKHEKIGGILRYGIPKFRLDKKWVDALEEELTYLGVKINCNTSFGKDITLDDLQKKYDKIILAFGANVSSKMNIEGEELPFVLGANELLENENHPNYKNKKVAIIGGGNVAMDAARTIKRLGAEEVTIVYRRARAQMPAEKIEVER